MLKNNLKTCVVYTRFSDEKQSKGFSLQYQKSACLNFCKENNITIQQIYEDRAKTGTNASREAFQDMYGYIKKNKNIDYVIVHKLDRFGRNISNYYMLKAEFKKYNCEIKSITEIMGEGPESILMEAVYNGLAETESKRIGIRAKAGMLQSVKSGKWQNGNPPYGYIKNESGKLIPEVIESLIIKDIFTIYTTKNLGITSISKYLNEKHIKTKKGNAFKPMTIRHILCNRVYLGHLNFAGEEYENTHPSLISKRIYENTQSLLKSRVGNKNRVRNKNYLLTGLIECTCGYKFCGVSHKPRGVLYQYYACSQAHKGLCNSRRIPKKEIEDQVIEKIKVLANQKTVITNISKELYKNAKAYHHEKRDEKQILQNTIKKRTKQISNVVNAITRLGDDSEELEEKLRELKKEKTDMTGRLNHINAFVEPLRMEDIALANKEIIKIINDYIESVENRRTEISRWIKKIIIIGNKPIVEFKCCVSSTVWLPRLELMRNNNPIVYKVILHILEEISFVI